MFAERSLDVVMPDVFEILDTIKGKGLDFPSTTQYLNEIGGRSFLTSEEEAQFCEAIVPYRNLVRDVMSAIPIIKGQRIPREEKAEVHLLELTRILNPDIPIIGVDIVNQGRVMVERFMDANYLLVVHQAGQFSLLRGRALSFGDLIAAGNFGLRRAALNFNYLEGPFVPFATTCVRQDILKEIVELADPRIPGNMRRALRQMKEVKSKLREKNKREPTDRELIKAMDIAEQTFESLKAAELAERVISLDVKIKNPDVVEEDDRTLIDIKPNIFSPRQEVYPSADMEYFAKELREEILDAIKNANLGERNRIILLLAYGFQDGICWTNQAMSTYFGVSRARINEVRRESLKKLRKAEKNLERLKIFLA